jgi:hypothetical protein
MRQFSLGSTKRSMVYILTILFIVYFLYTLTFAIKLSKSGDVFNDNQRLLHHVLIWIIPFFWIVVVKSMIKPTLGSDKFRKTKADSGFHESGIGIWGREDHHHTNEGHGDHGDD